MHYSQFEKIIINDNFNSDSIPDLQPNECNIECIKELADFFGTDFTDMIGYDQFAPHHDRTLWQHTLKFMDSIPKPGEPPYCLSESEYNMLMAVGFLHDMGKPASMTVNHFKNVIAVPDNHPSARYQIHNPDGTCDVITHSFKGHAAISRKIAEKHVAALEYPHVQAAPILFFVAHHDDFMRISTVNQSSINEMCKKILEMYHDSKELGYSITYRDFQLLMILGKADSMAQAKTVYEFNKNTNTFPQVEFPSDSLDRKIETYNQIEGHLPDILLNFIQCYVPQPAPGSIAEQRLAQTMLDLLRYKSGLRNPDKTGSYIGPIFE